MILGITGGIGCGKSAAAALFEREGFRRLDSDAVIRNEILPSERVTQALRERYGDSVFGENGLDRSRLAARVFDDVAELRWLEELTHPILFCAWRSAFAASPGVRWAVEVPLLFEKRLENWFDFTICVASSAPQQLVRLEQRGLSRVLAGQRISKQLPLVHKIELADFVLWNDGSHEFLGAQVGRLIATVSAAR